MSTSQVIWTIIIVVAALILIGLVGGAMRKKSHADKHARAEELREQAGSSATDIPEAESRAREAQVQAEQARIRAEEEAERAREAHDDLLQQEALHEDQIREADRLDPKVDHRADDYSPEVSTTSPRDETGGADDAVLRDRLEGDTPEGRHRT